MKKPNTTRVIQSVTKEFAVTRAELLGHARPDRIAFPRHVAMTLLYDALKHSSSKVGEMFRKDHTAVLYAMSVVRDRCATNRKALEQVNRLREQFGLEAYRV